MGLQRGTVELEPHDPVWRERAEREVERLRTQANDHVIAIEHVGSTAVPDIPAKPVLDLLAVVEPGAVGAITATFADAGYEPRPDQDVPDRAFLARGPPDERTHYLSVTERGSSTHRQQVAFRDYLRENPGVAEVYAAVKKELAKRYPDDRTAYTAGKAVLISRVTERALDG